MLRLYVRFRRYIINHPFWPYFLSHGVVHIVGAIITLFLCVYFYNNSLAYEPAYKQVNLRLTDNFFGGAKYIEIAFDSSEDVVEKDSDDSYLYLYAAYGPVDTSSMTKVEPSYRDPERITFIGHDDYTGRAFFATPRYNPFIDESSQTYRVTGVSVETLNSKFICINDINTDTSVCHIDSLSSEFIQQSTYCDYREVSYKKVGSLRYESNLFNALILKGNFIKDSKENPYYHFSLIINDRFKDYSKAEGKVTFNFANDSSKNPLVHLNFLQCVPSTYYYNPVDGLTFEIQDVLENGGVYFLAEDLAKKDRVDRKIFISSVLMGACLAFLIDIVVNLIVKWRDLAKRKKRII